MLVFITNWHTIPYLRKLNRLPVVSHFLYPGKRGPRATSNSNLARPFLTPSLLLPALTTAKTSIFWSFNFLRDRLVRRILATGLNLDAEHAEEEGKDQGLFFCYRLILGEDAEPPPGSYESDGALIPDADGGVERLRRRPGSISTFVQELLQTFSRWYNKKHKRKGHLWAERFKGVLVKKGEAQLICSAYIDLNPIRANIVRQPEAYRWSSLGLFVRSPKRSKKLLNPIFQSYVEDFSQSQQFDNCNDEDFQQRTFSWYREFVYINGAIEVEGKARIAQELVADVKRCHGGLGIGDILSYRVKNISEGLAIGGYSFISLIQERLKRQYIHPRSFLQGNKMFATRVLR
ncbi:MAG: hypothetical protein GY757_30215 [bacterium]|nr:hypothetical protein [bacterium]